MNKKNKIKTPKTSNHDDETKQDCRSIELSPTLLMEDGTPYRPRTAYTPEEKAQLSSTEV